MANNIIINQSLDALRASLPMGDIVSTTVVKGNCTNENYVTVKIMNVDFVCYVREHITKATLNPTLATMQTMNNDKQQILLVTQYVTPQISTELANRGINYLDRAGNCLVRYTKAGKLIFQIFNQGRKNTESKVKTYPVFQDAGLKVVFYLLQNADNIKKPYREIKEQIGVSWGGEPAANLTDGYLQPGLFDIYTEIPAAHLVRTGVVKQDANGEIHLYNKFWNWETDNRTVPAILIYADLMGSGNSRCLEAAQRILRNELKDFE